ncbi:ATP-binding protein [Streptomyces lycii]|uniref:ATP-binding protein n=1 Tax=Streptomyces lycii TaxID=2654337 RepID=A0ABQ7FF56_9ACTN|nr:ATP-binding protein [Streptomyces lycii]KAF4405862.1 ATP-binding protein [Streptomyces lycii]
MLGSGIVGPGPRCVVPFTAYASEVRGLRRAAASQLAQWRLPALLDKTQLAVSELAANVVQHVGEGAVAALVMEVAAARLRIEMHDEGRTLPAVVSTDGDSERGRGLRLVAVLADESGAALTFFGKVVWCEFGAGTPGGGHRGPVPVRAGGTARPEFVA